MKMIGARLASLLVLAAFGSSFLPSSLLCSIAPLANEFARPLSTNRILNTQNDTGVSRLHFKKWKAVKKNARLLKTQHACLPFTRPTCPCNRRNAGAYMLAVASTYKEPSYCGESHTNLCVRTNDGFEVDVECRVDSFVYEEQEDKPAKAIQTPTKLRSDRLSHRSNVMEVQRMMGRLDKQDDGVIVNDEAIYFLTTVIVGCRSIGCIWIPTYAKQFGTGPMEIYISGYREMMFGAMGCDLRCASHHSATRAFSFWTTILWIAYIK